MAQKTDSWPNRAVRFGVFEMNPGTGDLFKDGVRVRLPRQLSCILSVLIEKPGEIVTREEIRRRLWAPDIFVDFERNLNSAIKKLRKALGDSR